MTPRILPSVDDLITSYRTFGQGLDAMHAELVRLGELGHAFERRLRWSKGRARRASRPFRMRSRYSRSARAAARKAHPMVGWRIQDRRLGGRS